MLILQTLFCTSLTLIGYGLGFILFKRFPKPWLNPLYTVTLSIIGVLFLLGIDSQAYVSGSSLFSFLLGTATVSLAIPLYKQVQMLKKHLPLILLGVVAGTVAGIVSVFMISSVFHINKSLLFSLIPKSVTIPIALSISNTLGGVPSLTVLFVVTSGVFSMVAGPLLLKKIGIKSQIAKGLALGTSAQALGAGRALEWGEIEGAMGSAAMSMSALVMSILSPFLVYLTYF